MTLVEFLRARLDEDEQWAKAAATESGPSWEVGGETVNVTNAAGHGYLLCAPYDGALPPGVAEHAARHDPARVLAEVDAKRRIVDEYEKAVQEWRETVSGEGEWARGESSRALHQLTGRLIALELVVRHHTTVYDSHPDYDESWRP